ncbi:MAG: hypothetical protein MZV70_04775 [Desulfobacterales bacterium]|nr:hypothetical protein [Desulfobacterales bacterium]
MDHARRKGRTEGLSRRYVQDAGRRSSRTSIRSSRSGRWVSSHYVGYGIVRVSGLPNIRAEELVLFPKNLQGLVFNIDPDEIGVILLEAERAPQRRAPRCRRTGRVLDVPVGEALIGRVVDAIGRPLDNQGEIRAAKRLPVEREAPPVMARDPVTVPLQTGIKVIDALIPIGRGQRELIVGRPADGQDGHRPGHHHQPEGQGRHLHLLRHRQEVLRRGQGHRRPQGSTTP